jgi:hypothetical protein
MKPVIRYKGKALMQYDHHSTKKFNQYLISLHQCHVFNNFISSSSISNTAKAEGCHKDNVDGYYILVIK